ncbi:unnamed protein product [Musa acuminata subsp. malaccensis]|uniref:(wild Malaysian banana) hypothetical protein n=1 Tax=Musa acuminata subsp. malaccensis TaxID=214687 RepID=A0A804I6W6_MUSAM|nr:unnamed protein product [Musa acuminata subsp. malaccensis]
MALQCIHRYTTACWAMSAFTFCMIAPFISRFAKTIAILH